MFHAISQRPCELLIYHDIVFHTSIYCKSKYRENKSYPLRYNIHAGTKCNTDENNNPVINERKRTKS